MTAEHGRFGEAAVTTITYDIAPRLRATTNDARLSRLTNNTVFALPAAGLASRITSIRSGDQTTRWTPSPICLATQTPQRTPGESREANHDG